VRRRRATQRHYHKLSEEFYFILEGQGEIEIDGERQPAQPGDAIRFRPVRGTPFPRLKRSVSFAAARPPTPTKTPTFKRLTL